MARYRIYGHLLGQLVYVRDTDKRPDATWLTFEPELAKIFKTFDEACNFLGRKAGKTNAILIIDKL